MILILINFHLGWFTKKAPHKSPKNSVFPLFYERFWDLWGAFFGDQPKWQINNLFHWPRLSCNSWQSRKILSAKLSSCQTIQPNIVIATHLLEGGGSILNVISWLANWRESSLSSILLSRIQIKSCNNMKKKEMGWQCI